MDYPRVFLEGLLNAGGARAIEEYIDTVERRRGRGEADYMRSEMRR